MARVFNASLTAQGDAVINGQAVPARDLKVLHMLYAYALPATAMQVAAALGKRTSADNVAAVFARLAALSLVEPSPEQEGHYQPAQEVKDFFASPLAKPLVPPFTLKDIPPPQGYTRARDKDYKKQLAAIGLPTTAPYGQSTPPALVLKLSVPLMELTALWRLGTQLALVSHSEGVYKAEPLHGSEGLQRAWVRALTPLGLIQLNLGAARMVLSAAVYPGVTADGYLTAYREDGPALAVPFPDDALRTLAMPGELPQAFNAMQEPAPRAAQVAALLARGPRQGVAKGRGALPPRRL